MRLSDRLLLVVAPAAVFASADLIVKANVPTASWAFHHRSNAWVALSVALLVGALMLTLVPSTTVALAAGMMSGGVIGNLVSARSEGNWVPNPLTLRGYGYGVAFNLADVFFLLGNLLLMTTLIAATLRHPERLVTVRAWERAVLRRLGF